VEPNWKPLEEKLGSARCVGFMFMGRINGINQYKHGITRTYLNLDDQGNCRVRANGVYVPGNWDVELARLEACLANLGASLTTAYDDAFIASKQKELQRKGISLLTLTVDPRDTKIR
jgi:hypothetical protein